MDLQHFCQPFHVFISDFTAFDIACATASSSSSKVLLDTRGPLANLLYFYRLGLHFSDAEFSCNATVSEPAVDLFITLAAIVRDDQASHWH